MSGRLGCDTRRMRKCSRRSSSVSMQAVACLHLGRPPNPAPPAPPHPQVLRLSSQDVPTSYAYDLEAATIVQVGALLCT